MKRPRQHVLEEESRRALKSLLPAEWLIEDVRNDYGIDMQITIVDGEDITNTVFSVQLKATDNTVDPSGQISLRMATKNLKYYEKYPLPIFILYYFKTTDSFYCLFSQRYIKETLSTSTPEWRNRKTNSVTFPPDSMLQSAEQLRSMVFESAFHIALYRLNLSGGSTIYYLDGIPKSDDAELKAMSLQALNSANRYEFRSAIDIYRRVLTLCTVSPTEKMAILISMGNAYDALSLFDDAQQCYADAELLLNKIGISDASAGKACIYSGLGRVHASKSAYSEALHYQRMALRLFRKMVYTEGEAGTRNNMGIVYREQGDLKKALYNTRLALKLHNQLGDTNGQAIALGNIGNIFNQQEDYRKALRHYLLALRMHRRVKNRAAEANILGSLGIIYGKLDDSSKSISFLAKAFKIFRSIEELEGQATTLNNLANAYFHEDKTKALKYATSSRDLSVRIGNRHGEALSLATMGSVYGEIGDLKSSLRFLTSAESILVQLGEKTYLPAVRGQILSLRRAAGYERGTEPRT